MPKHPKRPRDMMQLAKMVGELATGEESEPESASPSPDAVKRGKARAAALTPRKRKAIASKAARKRWGKSK